jgi:hypothetical protein
MSVTQTGRRSLFKLASTLAAAVLSLFLTTRGIQPAWAQATETDSAVQSVVQGVRDSVQRRVRKNTKNDQADLTTKKSECPSCGKKARSKARRERRH